MGISQAIQTADGARPMWPALAKANGIDPKSITWVCIDANFKLSALKSKSIDITTSFYNIGLDKPFDVKTVHTNEFLDRSIRMPK